MTALGEPLMWRADMPKLVVVVASMRDAPIKHLAQRFHRQSKMLSLACGVDTMHEVADGVCEVTGVPTCVRCAARFGRLV
jgi:hypothetical protein